MNPKAKHIIILAVAALTLPLSRAGAATSSVSMDWNNNTNNEVGGSITTVNATAGSTITLPLYLVAVGQNTDTVDYWLSQFSGPTTGAFSIMTRDRTGSSFGDNPSSSDGAVAASTDMQSNSAASGGPDGVPDNELGPQNAFNLGAGTPNAGSAGGDLPPGTYLVANYTFSIANNASGTYQIRSFDYSGRGWSDTTNSVFDQPFTAQAAININVAPVPEPATWSLFGLGGLGSLGLTFLRSRRLFS